MNIFERRYKALRILSQLPDVAHHAVIKKVGGKPFDGGAEYDAFADKLADLFDIEEHVSVTFKDARGYVYAGPGEGVVIEPNRGHPTPERAWFSINKDDWGRYDVHVNGQLLESGPFRNSGDAYAAGVKALGAHRRNITGGRRTPGVGYWEYEVQS